MWPISVGFIIFASVISTGLSVSPPAPHNCAPTYSSCRGPFDCPVDYPFCTAGACCRRPIFPPLCARPGPRCGPNYPPCRPGYFCQNDHCCQNLVIPQRCPEGYISGPPCPPSQCPTGFSCMNGRCCKAPTCPKGMLYTGVCEGGKECDVGRCLGTICCVAFGPRPFCPDSMVYVGRCNGGKCKMGRCISEFCCRQR